MGKSATIASNTLVLFARMLVITVLNLYSVRLVLAGLGVSDYGLYTTVAGVVTLSSCLSSVLAVSVQRFYSYYMGLKDEKRLRDIFSSSINIVLALSLAIIIVFETLGLWFVEAKLSIPSGRMAATLWLYHFSIFSFVFTIIRIPYSAAVFAHEQMGVYAMMSTADCLLRVLVAALLPFVAWDRLEFYGLGLLLVSVLIFLLYALLCSRRYTECAYSKVGDQTMYRQLLSFSTWTLFGALASIGMIQGSAILLNMFFGTIVVAAFGISQQIYNAFNTLCNSIVLAFRPAMIKSYAEGDYEYVNKLFVISNKSIFYLLLLVGLPLVMEMDTILSVWLNNVSSEMVLFARLIIVFSVCLSLNSPITAIVQATGRVRVYHLCTDGVLLMCPVLSYALFKLGFPAGWVFYSMIVLCLIAHLIRLLCLRSCYGRFRLVDYMVKFVLPSAIVFAASLPTVLYIHGLFADAAYRFVSMFTVAPIAIIVFIFILGLSKDEKKLFRDFWAAKLIKR